MCAARSTNSGASSRPPAGTSTRPARGPGLATRITERDWRVVMRSMCIVAVTGRWSGLAVTPANPVGRHERLVVGVGPARDASCDRPVDNRFPARLEYLLGAKPWLHLQGSR